MEHKKTNNFEPRYLKAKEELLSSKTICEENRKLFSKFFEQQEYKLKRINNLSKLDDSTYKTLYHYIMRFKNVNKWFNNKPLVNITKKEIKDVYDRLEDGEIVNSKGKKFESKDDYYSKVFKSKLFKLAGKDNLAREVIEYSGSNKKAVRFITEADFKKVVNSTFKPLHKLLIWLAWDIGENINSLLKLRKVDFYKQQNPHTKEPEYMVNLRKDILKRSRTERSEITNYPETVQLLDQILPDYSDYEMVFNFDYANSKKIIDRAVKRANVKCIPNGEKVTWKDLRSGMACDLLKKGWSTDEVNARLGHKPSSDEIDKYVNFLAIDRHRPKRKMTQFTINNLKEELEEIKEMNKLEIRRNESLKEQLELQQKQMDYLQKQFTQFLIKTKNPTKEELISAIQIKRTMV